MLDAVPLPASDLVSRPVDVLLLDTGLFAFPAFWLSMGTFWSTFAEPFVESGCFFTLLVSGSAEILGFDNDSETSFSA